MQSSRLPLVALACAALAGCSSGGGGGDWYYHWNCNGDPDCLSTNAAGKPSGTLNEGPNQQSCTPLLTFAQHFWGDAAVDACDQSEAWDGNSGQCGGGTPCGGVCARTATDSANCGACGHQCSAALPGSSCVAAACQCAGGRTSCAGANGAAACVATATDSAHCGSCGNQCQTGATCSAGKCVVTLVSVAVTPANPTLFIGRTLQFSATGTYSDGSTMSLTAVSWSSSAQSASIDGAGLATALAAGADPIHAVVYTPLGQITGSTTLTVIAAALQSIAVTPVNPTIAKGLTEQFAATGSYSDASTKVITAQAAWSAATAQAASIDASGLATGVGAGTSAITATLGSVSGSTTLTVAGPVLQSITVFPATTASDDRITQGLTRPLVATGHYSDGSAAALTGGVTWASLSPQFVSVDQSGLAGGVAPGSSLLTASIGAIEGGVNLTTVAPGTAWTRLVSPTLATLWAVAWSGTQFVSVGDAGSIFTSPDGLQWTGHSFNTGNSLHAVAWSGAQFVAVGTGGLVLTSPDGAAWTARASGTSSDLNGVAASPSRWVAVGAGGAVITSLDGATWSASVAVTAQALAGVCWSGSEFLAVGTATVATSTDGVTWTLVSSSLTGIGQAPLWAVTFSRHLFVGLDPVGVGSFVVTSSDGTGWGFTSLRDAVTNVWGISWTGTQYAVVGDSGAILTSPDTGTWTTQNSGTTNRLRGVAWSGSRFVAVGETGTIVVTAP